MPQTYDGTCKKCSVAYRGYRKGYCSSECYRSDRRYEFMKRSIEALTDDPSLPWGTFPCLLWPYGRGGGNSEYGVVTPPNSGHSVPVSIAAYEFVYGKIAKGFCACHHCDVKLCYRPSHIYAGTPAQNAADAAERDLIWHGDRSTSTKIPDADIPLIHELHRFGVQQRAIAKMFNVCPATICFVLKGRHRRRLHPVLGANHYSGIAR